MPAYFSIVIVLAWMLFDRSDSGSGSLFHLAFADWATPLLIAMVLAIAWSWRRTVRGAIAASSLHAPMMMKFRLSVWQNRDGTDSTLIRQQPGWLRARADLRQCGPRHPRESIRMVLGGLFMPQRWTSRLRIWAWIALWSGVFIAMSILQRWQQIHASNWAGLWHAGLLAMLAWSVGFGASMTALMALLRLGRLWQRVNADLSMLALLPGLDERRDLVGAALLPPLRGLAILLVISLACVLPMHLHAQALTFIVVTQLGVIAFVVAFTLLILGGKLPPLWVVVALGILGFVLLSISLFIPILGGKHLAGGTFAIWLCAAWLALCAILAWLGWRGWHGFLRRPHPYMPNGT
jgi:hypothetical protein